MCVFTEKLGKQHIGYAVCLLQNIARSFTEFAKYSNAELAELDIKVSMFPSALRQLSLTMLKLLDSVFTRRIVENKKKL